MKKKAINRQLEEKNKEFLKILMRLLNEYIDNSSNDFNHSYSTAAKTKLLIANQKILELIIIYTPIKLMALHQEVFNVITKNCDRLFKKREFDTMFTKTRNCFEEHLDILNKALSECMDTLIKDSLQMNTSQINGKVNIGKQKPKSTSADKKKKIRLSTQIMKLSGDIEKPESLKQSRQKRKTDVKPINAITTKSSIWTVKKK
jgi:hypothetical protein